MLATTQLSQAPATVVRSHSWRWLSRFIGLLLISTALLKLDAVRSGSMSVDPILHSHRAVVAVVMVEMTLASWLLIASFGGGAGVLGWLASLGFFSTALVVAFLTVAHGVSHCPCFGSAKISPWYAVLLDVSILAGLILVRPGSIQQVFDLAIQKLRGVSRSEALLASIAGIAVIVAFLIARYPPDWLATVRGESLVMRDDSFDTGAGQYSEWATVTVWVRNVSSEPVTIIGGTSNCSCVAISSLPVTIASREQVTIPIKVKFVGSPGYFARRFVLFTDSPATRSLSGVIAGRVATTEGR